MTGPTNTRMRRLAAGVFRNRDLYCVCTWLSGYENMAYACRVPSQPCSSGQSRILRWSGSHSPKPQRTECTYALLGEMTRARSATRNKDLSCKNSTASAPNPAHARPHYTPESSPSPAFFSCLALHLFCCWRISGRCCCHGVTKCGTGCRWRYACQT